MPMSDVPVPAVLLPPLKAEKAPGGADEEEWEWEWELNAICTAPTYDDDEEEEEEEEDDDRPLRPLPPALLPPAAPALADDAPSIVIPSVPKGGSMRASVTGSPVSPATDAGLRDEKLDVNSCRSASDTRTLRLAGRAPEETDEPPRPRMRCVRWDEMPRGLLLQLARVDWPLLPPPSPPPPPAPRPLTTLRAADERPDAALPRSWSDAEADESASLLRGIEEDAVEAASSSCSEAESAQREGREGGREDGEIGVSDALRATRRRGGEAALCA
jgi:hypothetical protein